MQILNWQGHQNQCRTLEANVRDPGSSAFSLDLAHQKQDLLQDVLCTRNLSCSQVIRTSPLAAVVEADCLVARERIQRFHGIRSGMSMAGRVHVASASIGL